MTVDRNLCLCQYFVIYVFVIIFPTNHYGEHDTIYV